MLISKRKSSPFIKNIKSGGGVFSGSIFGLNYQLDGKLLISGSFTDYGGFATRNYVIRLNSDNTIDTTFCINASDNSKFNASSYVTSQPDGKVLIGGSFSNYNGTSGRNYLVRLNSDGTLDTAFCANAVDGSKFSSFPYEMAVQSDGKILVGGFFTNYAGTTNRNQLIRLNSDGTLDTAFCANAVDGGKFSNTVYSIAIQSDGKILVAGTFTNYGGVTGRNKLVRLNSDGTLDTTFCANAVDGSKFTVDVQEIYQRPDGKILLTGGFTNYGGVTGRSYIVQLNSDGTVDTAFCTAALDNKFNISDLKIGIQNDSKLLISGTFANYGGVTGRNRLIRLNSDGTVDDIFCANAVDGGKFNNVPMVMMIKSDGKILIGGGFQSYGGIVNRNYLVLLNSDGTVDDIFCASVVDGNKMTISNVSDITVQSDEKVIICGGFTNYAGTANRNYLVRLNSDGTVDNIFCANAVDLSKFSASVFLTTAQNDGKILVGGSFSSYGGTVGRQYLIRLNSDGTLDTAFCANAVDGSKFSSNINSIAVQSDGKILVGGQFTNYAGTTGRNRLIRLNSDGTLDTAFCANASDASKISSTVSNLYVQSDGKILVGGAFISYGAVTNRNRLVRLNSDGTLDTAFCANAVDGTKFNSGVNSMVVQSDGKILVGGFFTNYAGTTSRSYLIRLNSDGTLDTAFCANAVDGGKIGGTVNSVIVQSNGEILFGGQFNNYAFVTGRSNLIKLNSDGTLDTQFCVSAVDGGKFGSSISSLAELPNTSILIGGAFSNYRNSTYSKIRTTRLLLLRENGILK